MKTRNATIAFDALSHNMRVKIFRKLVRKGEAGMGASELCKFMDIPPATLSFHMSKLANGDLVNITKRGKYVTYHANHKKIQKLIAFLTEKCSADQEAEEEAVIL